MKHEQQQPNVVAVGTDGHLFRQTIESKVVINEPIESKDANNFFEELFEVCKFRVRQSLN